MRYAGFWIRFVANLLDFLILELASAIIVFAVLGAIYWVRFLLHRTGSAAFFDEFNPFMVQIFLEIVSTILGAIYYIYGQYRWGTTLGKWPLHVYVVDAKSFGPLTLKQSTIRYCAYLVSYIPLCTGFLMVAFQPEKRGLHDLIAHTVSIYKPKI